ncbi:MAG TPA: winged helix-turn-helix domain-containing protein [Pyrinomonadaceae bacterium]|nr:winged helix-turn-helix domain-containing protein [Pyrinomonadaceae bacterium]
MGDIPMHFYEFGPFRVDARKRLLLRDGNPVRLPAKAFEILLVLLQSHGRLVEKDDLMRRVWPDAVVEENNLTVNISALRKSLSEAPGEHRYVLTVPGRGYQFVADVTQYDDESVRPDRDIGLTQTTSNNSGSEFGFNPNHAEKETPLLSRDEHKVHRRRYPLLLLSAILIAAVVIVAYFVYSRSFTGHGKTGITSIAVLPFANNTGDPNTDYLSDGIPESLINSLSQLRGVKVIARSSTFKYRGAEMDLNEVSKTLGVQAILTGRVTQRGDNLSINVELLNVSDKTQIWGEQYDRKLSDLLATQRDITHEIVEKLKLKVAGEEKGPARHYTESNEAYQLYLKGRFHWNKRTAEALNKAIEYFNEAIAKDPNFALAYAGLADCYVVPANRMAPKDAMPKAKTAAIRALELDETLAEAHASLGRVFAAYEWDWKNAEKEYKRALELNSQYAIAHQWYGGYLSVMGRSNEAIAERKQALELEPLSLTINFELGLGYYYDRDYDRAIDQFQKTLELDQEFPAALNFLPAAYEQKGMYSEAIAGFKKALPLSVGGEWTLSRAGLGHVLAVTGKRPEALAVLNELERISRQEYVTPTSIALIYAGLSDKDQAFAELQKGYEQRAFQLQWIKLDPRWDSLRSDPRFHDLIRRMGMPE